MKKGNSVMFFGIFFLAASIGELYCLLQFRNDIIIIVGVTIVMLIAAYLWMDAMRTAYEKEVKKIEEKLKDLEKLQNLEKLQKAIFITMKRLTTITEDSIRQSAEEDH